MMKDFRYTNITDKTDIYQTTQAVPKSNDRSKSIKKIVNQYMKERKKTMLKVKHGTFISN